MKKILYIRNGTENRLEIVEGFKQQGYVIDECGMSSETIAEILNRELHYFVISCGFLEGVCKACVETMTKYLVWLPGGGKEDMESRYIGNVLNYYVCENVEKCDELKEHGAFHCYCIKSELVDEEEIEDFVLNKEERAIYQTMDSLQIIHRQDEGPVAALKSLCTIEDKEEILKKTESFFDKLEEEKELSILLKELLLSYIDGLLARGEWDAWREIVLWSNRRECKDLLQNFWQFFLIKKCVAIYSEETLQYYENGDIPCIIQMRSFKELSETYFRLLFLLRRLVYGVCPEENLELIEFILEKRLSMVFVKHVIEHNQVEDKEKVYRRLEELLVEYEQ